MILRTTLWPSNGCLVVARGMNRAVMAMVALVIAAVVITPMLALEDQRGDEIAREADR